MRIFGTASLSVAIALSSVACTTVGPDYRPAQPVAAAAWAAPLPHGGKTSEIADWWGQFDDPLVGRLVTMAEADSPSLAQAWASIEKARATLASVRSGRTPSLTASASASRERASGLVDNVRSAGFDSSWEIDLFGKLRRNEEAAAARVEARTGDWNDARVSLAAEVADTYVQWKGCELLAEAYAQELVSNAQTQTTTLAAVRAGLTAPADAALARASLASARSTLIDQRAQCDLLVKALVYLTGAEEGALRAQLSSAPHG
ncbi:hypothetical protein CLD22_25190, partial [Rubrivivax gelatinosus]|nr:hypothetical protein [Rubrivivax gelatinosus]